MTPQQLRNSILQMAIEGKLTRQLPEDGNAADLLKKIKAEKARLIKEKKIKKEKPLPEIGDDEIPFEIPDNWCWVRLGNLVSVLGDGIHGTPEYDVDGEYYFVNGNNLSNGRIVFKGATKKVSYTEYVKYAKELNSKTILVSINGTIGNVAFYDGEKVVLGKSACYFNLLNYLEKRYLYRLLKTDYFIKYAVSNATGSTIKNVSLKVMKEWIVPLPPLEEQKRIVARLEKILPLVDAYEKAYNELQELNKKFPV
ncbi:MAG: restriction endonuclease subunit S, partial [Selenomonadaceae bacterium]|nr:restriction endonuclease subunit S [Selenomonadaceae bacterium]